MRVLLAANYIVRGSEASLTYTMADISSAALVAGC